jgi:NAD(P)-dependent dehydrogenase (short-subunit alcohol dehydrogenase family)
VASAGGSSGEATHFKLRFCKKEKEEKKMSKLEGKVAVITGGSTGIGFATAQAFVQEGAHVFITGRRKEELDRAKKELGSNVTIVQGDVSNLADLDRLYTAVKESGRKIDIVFANAGVGDFQPLGGITEDVYDKIFNVNVKGLVFTVQKALPLMNDGGSIILNASVAGSKGYEAFSVYSATKAAVRSFARSWTTDLKTRGIRVNAISPGPIDTPIFSTLSTNGVQLDEVKAGFASQVPLGRMGQPEEIAKAALFLGSSDSSFVAGTELFVDGGLAQV